LVVRAPKTAPDPRPLTGTLALPWKVVVAPKTAADVERPD
jgi:hypothetical protein